MQWDQWTQWVLLGVALVGLVVLVALTVRLVRLVKTFGRVVAAGSSRLAEATVALEAAQSASGSLPSGRAASSAAYTRESIPTREADI